MSVNNNVDVINIMEIIERVENLLENMIYLRLMINY